MAAQLIYSNESQENNEQLLQDLTLPGCTSARAVVQLPVPSVPHPQNLFPWWSNSPPRHLALSLITTLFCAHIQKNAVVALTLPLVSVSEPVHRFLSPL